MSDKKICDAACLCGDVTFKAELVGKEFHACHCAMCQKQTGGPYMGVQLTEMPAVEGASMAWYSSSDRSERGFCNKCGSNLFWRMKEDHNAMCIASVGVLKGAEDLELGSHIFIDGKPDYYDFNDGKPCLTEAQILEQYS